MTISLSDKIKAQDMRNLTFMRFSRERSWRVFKIYMFLAVPIGALFFSVWHSIAVGLPPSGISSGFVVVDWLMEVGNALYVFIIHMIFGYLYLGVPLVIAASWFGYRTYKKGLFSSIEAGSVALLLVAGALGLIMVITTGSFVVAYQSFISDWITLLPIWIAAVLSAIACRWVAWGFDVNP